MAQRRTDTPLFRKALAVTVLWLLAWAVIGYRNHQAIQPYGQRARSQQIRVHPSTERPARRSLRDKASPVTQR